MTHVRFKEMFDHNPNRAATDLIEFVSGKYSLNKLRNRWPKRARSVIYRLERLGVEKARRSAVGALRNRGYISK